MWTNAQSYLVHINMNSHITKLLVHNFYADVNVRGGLYLWSKHSVGDLYTVCSSALGNPTL